MPKSGVLDPVVIDAEDTDVIVLSAFVAQNTEGILAIKHKKGIISCRDLCQTDVAEIIVLLHIFSGCGTTSRFYGHGRKSVYGKVTK